MYVIGELINGMFSKVAKALQEKDAAFIKDLAARQADAGCQALDVNCGPASRDAANDLCWLVETIQSELPITLSIDTTKPDAMEAALKVAKNKTIINSSSAEIARLKIFIPMAKKYNSSLIALAMDEKGVPHGKDARLELAAQILACAQEYEYPVTDIFLDPILLPINVAQNQLFDILESIKDLKNLINPGPRVIVGLSNVSQGAKNRKLINRTFLAMAQSYGLDAAILDPMDSDLMDSIAASEIVLNKNIYCDSFLNNKLRRSSSA